MSTIIVIKKGISICLASDSMISMSAICRPGNYSRNASKQFTAFETCFGITGSTRFRQAFEQSIRQMESKIELSDIASISDCIESVRQTLIESSGLNPNDSDNDEFLSLRGELLLANRWGIFGVDVYGGVTEYSSFWAKGTGDELALGALHAIYHTKIDLRDMAKRALDAASAFDTATGPPFHYTQFRLSRR